MLRLAYFEKLIGGDIGKCLPYSGRPRNLHAGSCCRTQTKMKPLIIRGEITSCCGRITCLAIHMNSRAEPIAVAASAAKRDRQPMLVAAAIHQDERMAAQNRHDRVHPAVIVQISESQTAARDRSCDSQRRHVRNGHSDSRPAAAARDSGANDRWLRRYRARGSAQRTDPSSHRCRNLPARRPSQSFLRSAHRDRFQDCGCVNKPWPSLW